jgi:hypothetical protein
MANQAYGGYTTSITVQNVGDAPATVNLFYYDTTGKPVGKGDSIVNLAVNGSWTVRQHNGNAFPAGGAGSSVIFSDQLHGDQHADRCGPDAVRPRHRQQRLWRVHHRHRATQRVTNGKRCDDHLP